MDENDRLRRVVERRRVDEAEAHRRKYEDSSRARLLRILKKKLTTAFIGALARVESHLGAALWGHGRPDCECSPAQLEWRRVWDECRTDILTNGNNQVRAVEAELAQHKVSWDRHSMVLPVPSTEVAGEQADV